MAGSPRYLSLLDSLFAEGSPPEIIARWDYLDSRWEHLEQRPTSPYNLKEIARTAYAILAKERKEDVSVILQRARELHVAKNAGYAGATNPDPWANFRLSTVFEISPFRGVLVRMSDKYIRITNLRSDASNERVGESIWDTLADLAAYALIAVCLLEEEKEYTTFHHPV